MAYCAQSDIVKKVPTETLVQLTDLENAGEVNTTVLAEAIEVADREIDSYLRVRAVAVPLTSTPSLVTQLSVALAVGQLYANRSALPKTVKRSVEWARGWLKDFAKGLVSLGDSDYSDSDPASLVVQYDVADRVFTRTSMDGF